MTASKYARPTQADAPEQTSTELMHAWPHGESVCGHELPYRDHTGTIVAPSIFWRRERCSLLVEALSCAAVYLRHGAMSREGFARYHLAYRASRGHVSADDESHVIDAMYHRARDDWGWCCALMGLDQSETDYLSARHISLGAANKSPREALTRAYRRGMRSCHMSELVSQAGTAKPQVVKRKVMREGCSPDDDLFE